MSLLPTTSDYQCFRNAFGGCDAEEGYDPNTCETYGAKCYSRTAPQCVSGVDNCFTDLNNYGECINNNPSGSSLFCRHSKSFPFGCTCQAPTATRQGAMRYGKRDAALLPTTSDDQCRRNVFGGCDAEEGYDPNSCETYGAKCYSRTAPQCVSGVDNCFTDLNNFGECINSNASQSSLYCRHNKSFPFGCTCQAPATNKRYAIRMMRR
jgi:hypothetical protein